MTLRQRIFIAIGLIAGLILAIVLYVYVLRGRASELATVAPTSTQATAQAPVAAQPAQLPVPRLPELSDEEREEMYVKQTARIFVERFGSYSNQNNNRHIDGVLSLSTPTMQAWLETQRLPQGETYYCVTTAVIASRIESRTATSAAVHVDVQQAITENGDERVEQKSGRVELEKIGEQWLVDGFFWNVQ